MTAKHTIEQGLCADLSIIINGLIKNFADAQALDHVSFTVPSGSIVALIGRNGAGKTTLVRCMLGLEIPDHGDISIYGMQPGTQSLKSSIGMMLQDSQLPESLTAEELCRLFASFYPNPLPLSTLLEITELAEFRNKKYGQLSGGQKRRVQFALSLVGDPKLLILDEPTAHMDAVASKSFWSLIKKLREQGKTIFLVTHQLLELESIASHVLVLDKGRVLVSQSMSSFKNSLLSSKIICKTKLNVTQIKEFPSVNDVIESINFKEIFTNKSDVVIKKILEHDPAVTDLQVCSPSIEDLLEAMIKQKVPA